MLGSEIYNVWKNEKLEFFNGMQRRGGVGFVVLVELERVTAAGCEHGHVAQ